MSTADSQANHEGQGQSRSCATALVCRSCEQRFALSEPLYACPDCKRNLEIEFDYELARQRFDEFPLSQRAQSIWRFDELLPIQDPEAQRRVGKHSSFTPLIKAERLGEQLGLNNLYVKDDSTSRPSLSYKDRVVSMSVARLLELGKQEIGCVSTGNVGTATAAFAAMAGVTPYVFYPNRLEPTKAQVCRALGASVCQVDGNYDEANKQCRSVAEATGLEFANITLRPFYSEGAKTMAFEIVEQLGWRAPQHLVIPAAGGTLSSRVHKGLIELDQVGLSRTDAVQMHIAQPQGCAPIASAILEGDSEIHACRPDTAAHSLAIGTPGDGNLVIDAVRTRGGTAAYAQDTEIFAGIDLLARTEGILTEPAGGTTIAVLKKLAEAGRFDPDEVVVAVITGNGLKTLVDHPAKPWPSMVPCESDAMVSVLRELQQGPPTPVSG
ncbi:MAG TPA: threonine synthase [Solirubrobacteraceae bacterium]|jgi:threonine synthase